MPLVLTSGFGTAQAQGEPPFDPAIDVQLFDMSPGPRSFMGVASGETEEKGQYSLDFLLTFLTDPFVIYNVDEDNDTIVNTRTDVVSSIFAGQLTGAYGLRDGLQLGVSLPLVFSMSGEGLDPASGGMASGGLQATGFGDLRIQAKGRLLRKASMRAAWMAGLTVPTSFGAGGNDFTIAQGVSNAGVVVGSDWLRDDTDGSTLGRPGFTFDLASSTRTDFNLPGMIRTAFRAIDEFGVVVVVTEDLVDGLALFGHPVGAVLGHADAVTPTASFHDEIAFGSRSGDCGERHDGHDGDQHQTENAL